MAGRASRKTVTVLFCDLAGSTALGERLDPEPLRLLLTDWYEAMRESVERHGGTVEKFIGDAVMAVFGVPQVHEDDALRAVRAATEMRAATGRVGTRLGVPIGVRIGVNTGEVVTGDTSTTLVTGDAVNTAKRLEEAAADGEILIGDTTRRLVAHGVELEPAEPVQARGKREPVPAWRVLAAIAGAPSVAKRLDVLLVGRRSELAFLRRELELAERDRACRLVTLLGAAGIGKSRLASELLDAARSQAVVLGARCLAYGDGITFLPLSDLVRSAGGEVAIERALAAEPDGPLIFERLCGTLGTGEAAVSSEEAFWAIRRILETLAREQPLVVSIEDIHWAEPTFLDLLEYVVGWSRDAPILLLCLARPELLETRPHWPGAILPLEPLSSEESGQLLEELATDWPLATSSAAEIEAVAEGNPLFIEQMVAALAEQGEATAVPPTIQALLAARLDRLAPNERAVLERAAVAGREFWRGTIAELSPAEERNGLGATLLALVRKELVRPERSSAVPGDDCFQFRHALIRDAAYSAIPKGLRAELHEATAGWLEHHAGEEELVAYHLEQSHLYGSELGLSGADAAGARAASLLATTGRRAFARNDAPAAANLLLRASDLLPAADPSQLELLRLAGLALWWSGEAERAREVVARQIAKAQELGDTVEEWSGRLDLAAGNLVSGAIDADELLTVAERALDVFAPDDNTALSRAWHRVAHAHTACGRYGLAAQASERALEHARAAGERFEEAHIVDVFCTSLLYGPASAEEAIFRCERMLAEATGRPLEEANIAASLAGLQAMRGEFDAARRHVHLAEERYEELGLRLALAGTTQISGPLELLAGDPVAAERELRRGLEILLPDTSDGYQEALLAEALYRQGRLAEAAAQAATARANAHEDNVHAQVLWRLVRAKLDAEESPEAAVALAREAVAIADTTDAPSLLADALADLASLHARAADEDAAVEAARRALDLYEQKGNLSAARHLTASTPHTVER
jgi:class 3 adenylate cyclase/tetratricopeptide (TPR) repeat protein